MARGRGIFPGLWWIAAALAALQPAGAVPAAAAGVVVAIDPGHGGIDPGAASGGLVEKEVVLDFARRLKAHIDAAPGLNAVLIRDEDSYLTLSERVREAHRLHANVLVSLHADKTEEGLAEGAHVYTLSPEGTDEAADALAERENRADVMGGVDLAGQGDDVTALLVDLAQRGTGDESQKLATSLMSAMAGQVTLLPTAPHREANFRILKAPDIPSVLVELGYISNAGDRERLVSEEWQERMAAALTEGLRRWTAVASPGFLAPKR